MIVRINLGINFTPSMTVVGGATPHHDRHSGVPLRICFHVVCILSQARFRGMCVVSFVFQWFLCVLHVC